MSNLGKILVIDDEKYIGWIIKKAFEVTENQVYLCETAEQGIREAQKCRYDIVFLDLRLPDMDGMDALVELKKIQKDLAVIIITAHGSIDTAIESMKKGAFDYITKPFDVDELLLQAEKAMEMLTLKEEVNYLRYENIKELDDSKFVSNNKDLSETFKSLSQVAKTSAPVLISGESGTGKELTARRIHQLGNRLNYPFVLFNCAIVSESSMESEIFGYEMENSTETGQKKWGKLAVADRGTIFIEEIEKMSLKVQMKLLKAIEHKKFHARIIAASNKDLYNEISLGKFREDLYYALNVFPIRLLPLRERKEDIQALVSYFIKKYDSSGKIKGAATETMKFLKSYHWPGNITELENVVERMVILSQDAYIKPNLLPKEIQYQIKNAKNPIIHFPEEGINLENVEKNLIIEALDMSGQNQSKAAQLLNITRSALIYRMQKYNIK